MDCCSYSASNLSFFMFSFFRDFKCCNDHITVYEQKRKFRFVVRITVDSWTRQQDDFICIFGFAATIKKIESHSYLNSLYVVFQGVFIFFSLTVKEETRKACKMLYRKENDR